jgi:hypothetical protein
MKSVLLSTAFHITNVVAMRVRARGEGKFLARAVFMLFLARGLLALFFARSQSIKLLSLLNFSVWQRIPLGGKVADGSLKSQSRHESNEIHKRASST